MILIRHRTTKDRWMMWTVKERTLTVHGWSACTLSQHKSLTEIRNLYSGNESWYIAFDTGEE